MIKFARYIDIVYARPIVLWSYPKIIAEPNFRMDIMITEGDMLIKISIPKLGTSLNALELALQAHRANIVFAWGNASCDRTG